MHAPPPDWRVQLSNPKFLSSINRQPPEDAHDEVLAEYWREAPSSTSAPSRQVQLRLTEICKQDPEQLPYLLRWFSKTDEEVAERLKAVYERIAMNRPKDFDPIQLRDWLAEHSPYFRDDLIAKTRETFSGADAETLRSAVKILAGLDRNAAELLLRSLAKSDNDFTRTAALVALVEFDGAVSDSERETWRADLRRIATNTAASPRARDYAITGVMRRPWPSDEEWFLSLFDDAGLAELRVGQQLLAPLCRVISDQPARWVPKLVAMINSPDRTKHGNAALCLSDIPQAEALRPLLPWLIDASWSPIGGDAARRRLIWNLAKVELPEAVPGLAAMLKHADPWLVNEAAESLVHQKANEAGPAVREALNKVERSHSLELARAAVRLGAFTADELTHDLELFVRKTATNEQSLAAERALDPFGSGELDIPLLVGETTDREPPPGGDLVKAVLRRADELATKEPDLADRLRTVVAGWGDPAAVTAVVQRLRSGDFTGRWLAKVMEPATPLEAALTPASDDVGLTQRHRAITTAVAGIEGLRGLARGVQAAITSVGVEVVLQGSERSATLALLASARLTRTRLPLAAPRAAARFGGSTAGPRRRAIPDIRRYSTGARRCPAASSGGNPCSWRRLRFCAGRREYMDGADGRRIPQMVS